MTPGQKLINVGMAYLGVHETSTNSDGGGPIDRWEKRWGLHALAWCGMYESGIFAEAGIDDGGVVHPSTAVMCERARAKGYVWDGHHPVPVGALWTLCGIHTCFVIKDNGDGTVSTLEGNHGNAVALGRRAIADASLIIVPPSILGSDPEPPPAPTPEYWLEDTTAQPKLYGPWRSKAVRDEKLAHILAERRAHARTVRGGKGSYAWLEGPRRLYGPWLDKEARDTAQGKLEQRLGHGLRAFSRTIHGSV